MPRNSTTNSGERQTIEQLQSRFQKFSEQKIKIETQRDHALEQLDDLKSQAKELYGSDDVEQLKSILQEMKNSNEEKRAKYQEALDAIDEDLAAIDEKFAQEIE
ncbi:MAG: hypothetical protein AB8B55_17145 [Mariniblastus sp.]